MTRRTLVFAAIGLVALLVPATALAKGASQATITGPGLGDAITLAGEGQAGGEKLMVIMQEGGFFPSVFLTTPNPMHAQRPDGELGPLYTIVYEMPGPNGALDEIRQDVYPYATPVPVTYMEPGQRYFTSEETVGGWYVASQTLTSSLVDVGLPESAPPVGDDGLKAPWTTLLGMTAVAAAALAAAALGVRAWRRERPAPA